MLIIEDVNCGHRAEVVFARTFSLSILCSLKEGPVCGPHERSLCCTFLRVEYLHQLFRLLDRFVFIYLMQSFVSLWIHGYLYSQLKSILPYFLIQLLQLWPLGAPSVGSCVPFTCPISMDSCFVLF